MHDSRLVNSCLDRESVYSTRYGAAYSGDSRELLAELPDDSIDLIVTSPPYGLVAQKEYGNPDATDYVDWFYPFAKAAARVLKPEGNFIVNVDGAFQPDQAVRTLYQYQLPLLLTGSDNIDVTPITDRNDPATDGYEVASTDETRTPPEMFNLVQTYYWLNPAPDPNTAQEYVKNRRTRALPSMEFCFWFTPAGSPPTLNPDGFGDDHDLRPDPDKGWMMNGDQPMNMFIGTPAGMPVHNHEQDTGKATLAGAGREHERGTPGLSDTTGDGGQAVSGQQLLAQEPNILSIANTASNTHYLRACRKLGRDPHPARFPHALPEYFIKRASEPDDVVLDIFAGSNITGMKAEEHDRQWIAFERDYEYLSDSELRFQTWTDSD